MMIRMKDLGDFSHLNELRTDEKFCDVIIKIGDRSFPCHRIILAATMKYFRSMFSGEYVEAEKQQIELKCVNAEEFEQLLIFVYGGSISVEESHIIRLLQIAHYLGPQSLEDSCVEYIVENCSTFSSDSVLSIYKFATDAMRYTKLVDVSTRLVAENFVYSSKTEKLYRVPGENLLQILAHPNLERDETAILDFLMAWVQFQSDEDKKLLPEMLNAINLKGTSRDWILKRLMKVDNVTFQPDTIAEDECGQFLQELSADMEVDKRNGTRQLPFLLFTLGYYDRGLSDHQHQYVNRVDMYRFRNMNSMRFLKQRYSFTSSRLNTMLECKSFLVGNAEFTLYYNCRPTTYNSLFKGIRLYIENDTRNELLSSYDMEKIYYDPNYENIFTAALQDSNIFFYDNSAFIMYSCERNGWFNVEGYKDVFAPSMLSIDNCLFMVGGLDSSKVSPGTSKHTRVLSAVTGMPSHTDGRLLKRYDVRENKWSSLNCMKYSRFKAASCVHNNIIYVSGGDNVTYYNNYNVEYYDIRAGKWGEFTTPTPKPKMNHCLVAYDDQLWFFGGQIPLSDGSYDRTCYSYNLKDDTWSEILSLPARYGERNILGILDVLVTDKN